MLSQAARAANEVIGFAFARSCARSLARFFSCGVMVFGLAWLAACSPSYDWREIVPAQEPLAMTLPGKPAKASRNINLDGRPVTMHMHGALVEGNSFTAAWTELDETTLADGPASEQREAARQKAFAAMQKGMAQNIAGTVVERRERTVALIAGSGQAVGRLPAVELVIKGTARGKPVVMTAIFAAFGARLYQFVVLGESVPAEHIKTFLDSVRIRTDKPSAVARRGDALVAMSAQ